MPTRYCFLIRSLTPTIYFARLPEAYVRVCVCVWGGGLSQLTYNSSTQSFTSSEFCDYAVSVSTNATNIDLKKAFNSIFQSKF